MPYTTPTLTEATTALAARLNDPSNVRWSAAELQTYIREALRVWSVLTQHWRDTGSFVTTPNQAFYALETELPLLRGQTYTNWDLVADLQYALLEPVPAGGLWTGTDQFTLDQLSTAINRRRDQFLRDTGVILTHAEILIVAGLIGARIELPEDILVIRRAAWRDSVTQVLYPLLVTDEWAANNYQPTWPTSTQPPQAYSVTVTPPLYIQLIPPPTAGVDGTFDLVTINKGATVDPSTAAALGIPDDYAWIIKYGALADLLSGDGLALDPARAAYCESRWQMGIDQVRKNSVVLTGQINNQPVTIGSLSDADRYSPTWQLVSGTPKSLLLTGQNLVAVWPPPGIVGGPWSITLDVVTNAPVPLLGAELLDISADVYDTILDLAQHTALFKEGPGQLELSMSLYERAMRAAGIDLRLQQASQPSRTPMFGQTAQDRRAVAEQRAQPAASQLVEVD